MKKNSKREQINNLLFALTDEGEKFRNTWRNLIVMAVWLLLSGFTMALTVFSAQEQLHKIILIVMSLLKYIPLMMVVYSMARRMAAKYLDDVYELNNEDIACAFLKDVTFGLAHHKITIKDGEITEKDEESPLILIGGPGFIQVNLDSVALLEKATGEPEVIYPCKKAWKIGSFERLREIGESDEVGEREYAIINLREQIVRNISVKSRTKDGIPVEAHDIKVKFNVLRRKDAPPDEQDETYLFDEKAVQALVYNQTTITPEPPQIWGVGFPWNTTVIPLIISEIERLITSHTANEILASIGQKEMDLISTAEQTVAQVRVEITGKNSAGAEKKPSLAPKSESRSKVTEHFYGKEFTDKAAAIGVHLNWIDIGTWEPSGAIRDKIKNAWNLARDNNKKHGSVERWKKKHTDEEIITLIDNTILSFYEKIGVRGSNKEKEKQLSAKDFQELISKNPQLLSNPYFLEQLLGDANRKSSMSIAFEILKAFRKELIAGQALIQEKEKAPDAQIQTDLRKIEETLKNINQFFPYQKPL